MSFVGGCLDFPMQVIPVLGDRPKVRFLPDRRGVWTLPRFLRCTPDRGPDVWGKDSSFSVTTYPVDYWWYIHAPDPSHSYLLSSLCPPTASKDGYLFQFTISPTDHAEPKRMCLPVYLYGKHGSLPVLVSQFEGLEFL